MRDVVVASSGTDWLTPLATLLAVLIGGVLSWIAQSRLAERRAHVEREAEAEAAKWLIENEARAAARVVQSDLVAAASRLESMVERRQWLSFYSLTLTSWPHGQANLAKRLNSAVWGTVAEVAMQLRAIDDLMRAAIADGGPQAGASFVPLSSNTTELLESILQATTAAYNLLADVAETPRVHGRLQAFERSASRTPR
jgi:hypothetical protein